MGSLLVASALSTQVCGPCFAPPAVLARKLAPRGPRSGHPHTLIDRALVASCAPLSGHKNRAGAERWGSADPAEDNREWGLGTESERRPPLARPAALAAAMRGRI